MTPTLPVDEAMRQSFYDSGAWGSRTFYEMASLHSTEQPNAPALTTRFRTFSWSDLVDAVDAFAADLAGRGLQVGDTIFVGAPNRVETVVALLAASRDSFICCPSPHRNHTVAEIAEMCERGACAAYIHSPGHGSDAEGDEILELIRVLPSLRHIYELLPGGTPTPFDGSLNSVSADARCPTGDPDLVTYLAFTSGSTGSPKGVMHSDNSQLVAARGIVGAWGFDTDTVTLSLSPFSHNLGCGTFWTSLVAGGEFVLHDWPRGESLYDHISRANVNYLVGVPTQAMDLISELKARGVQNYDRLKSFRVSAAACPEHVAAELYDVGIPVQKGYGMTETNGHQYGRPGDSRDQVIATSGVCCPGYAVRIFDANNPDVEASPGTPGLVGGKGASLMLGYFNDRKAGEDCINATGWFLTGDLGSIDENGYLTLTGRAKELIVRGGHNINPNLVEDLALRHPAIALAAAIPLVDDRLGERVCLAVMFETGQSVSAAEILEHLADKGLSRYDMPEFWLPVADIPLMPNGKMEKRQIMRLIGAGELSPQLVKDGKG